MSEKDNTLATQRNIARADKLNSETVRHEALELRKAGLTYRAIAKKLNRDVSVIYRHIKKALMDLQKLSEQEAEELKTLELARLDSVLLAIWSAAKGGHLGCIDRVLKICAKRCELLGLDAQSKGDGTGTSQIIIMNTRREEIAEPPEPV